MSKASAAEVQSQLYVALDQKYISNKDFKIIYEQADEVAKTVQASSNTSTL
jgi:four helix bundle protein